ncbi:hypothetical protein KTQ54_16645, partial [Komagataeibacter oboediens]|uniref:hypothetical protein n=2 Tax=Komagataeibacter oboediens TaxID=65958 RepID=UPI001C2BFC0F
EKRAADAPSARPSANTGHSSSVSSRSLNHIRPLISMGPEPSHSKNSRLSNFQPQQKLEHFEASLGNGQIDSLKLLSMIELMKARGRWQEAEIAEHQDKMIDILAESLRHLISFQTTGSL